MEIIFNKTKTTLKINNIKEFDSKTLISQLIQQYEKNKKFYNLIIIDFNNLDISMGILTDIVYTFEFLNSFTFPIHLDKVINLNKKTIENIKLLDLEFYFKTENNNG